MMVYDAFVKRVIYSNSQILSKLASIMMLLYKLVVLNAPILNDG